MKIRALAAGVALAALLMVVPSHALGAAATSTPPAGAAVPSPTAPVVKSLSGIDAQLWPEEQGKLSSALIVVGFVPTATPLPATVRIPLPAGATITWAGELGSGGTNTDVQREFRTVQGTGGQAIEVVAQVSRAIQYEADYTGAVAKDGKRTATLDWVQSAPADRIRFGLWLPLTAEDVSTEPPYMGQPQQNEAGEKGYFLAERTLALGEKFKLTVTYTKPQSAPASTSSGASSSTSSLLTVLVATLTVALAALVVVLVRGRRLSGTQDELTEAEQGPESPEAPHAEQPGAEEDSWGEADAWSEPDDARREGTGDPPREGP